MSRRDRERGAEHERTLADAEADPGVATDETRCACGSRTFLLEAFLQVEDGRALPDPVEVEALTCPECGREWEAVDLGGGRVVRGEFRGFADLDDGDDA